MTDPSTPENRPGFIPPHGGYENLKSYQMSVLVYDATVKFCDTTYKSYIENAPPEVAANTMLCLVHQTNYLVDQQLRQLEQAFLQEGGFTERLYQARQQARAVPPRPSFQRNRPNQAPASVPRPNTSYQSYAPPPKTGAPAPHPPAHP